MGFTFRIDKSTNQIFRWTETKKEEVKSKKKKWKYYLSNKIGAKISNHHKKHYWKTIGFFRLQTLTNSIIPRLILNYIFIDPKHIIIYNCNLIFCLQ